MSSTKPPDQINERLSASASQPYSHCHQFECALTFAWVLGDYEIILIDRPSSYGTTVMGNLDGFNSTQGHPEDWKPMTVALRDNEGKITAGLTGGTSWEWLLVSHLWVTESLRRRGLGRKIMTLAEHEALIRGCRSAHLDTFSFQALAFYKKIGYEEFGRLDEYPRGFSRYYLRKKLA